MNETRNSGGIGFIGLLTLLFIGLKLTGYIDWAWVWVLSPIWLTFVVLFVVLLGAALVSIWLTDRRRGRMVR